MLTSATRIAHPALISEFWLLAFLFRTPHSSLDIRHLHPEGMKINQPGVARQRYPGVNAETISTLKVVASAGLALCFDLCSLVPPLFRNPCPSVLIHG